MASPEVNHIPELCSHEELTERTITAIGDFSQEAVSHFCDLLDTVRDKAPAQALTITVFKGRDGRSGLDIGLWRTRARLTESEEEALEEICIKYDDLDNFRSKLDSGLELHYIDNPESISLEHIAAFVGERYQPHPESIRVIGLAKIGTAPR